jgi:hypothetical protein
MRTMMTFGIFCKDALWVAVLASVLSCVACCDCTPDDTADSLARDPQRLVIVLRQCRDRSLPEYERVCVAASEAVRRRFLRSDASHGQVPFAPVRADPAPTIEPTPWLAGS